MDKLQTLKGSQILYNDNRSRIEEVSKDVLDLKNLKVDGAYVSEDGKYLYLTSNGNDVTGPLGPFSGGSGGGGGSDNNAKITVTNLSGSLPTAIAIGASYNIKIEWSSIEDGISTGPGTLAIRVNNEVKRTVNIPQGIYSDNLQDILNVGDNSIKVTVTDAYGNAKSIIFSVKVVSYSLVSNFDNSIAYGSTIRYVYTAKGDGEKVMHYLIDGNEVGTKTITTTNREDTYTIPQQSHGAHIFTSYFDVTMEGTYVKSNELTYEIICYEEGDPTPIITSDVTSITTQQYSTISIPYYVYRTDSNFSDVDLMVNGEVVSSLKNVDRNKQVWTRRLDSVGDFTFAIKSGDTVRDISVSVTKIDVDVKAEEDSLVLYLTSKDRSNNEAEDVRTKWGYNGINAQFENFNWVTDGWVQDDNNIPVMRVKDDARITIPYKPFSNEYDSINNTGKTFEFEFSTSGVFDYDTSLISCFDGKVGFNITAQQALFKSATNDISTQYKENEHVRVSFAITDKNNHRLIYCYINGIISGIVQYGNIDNIFYQSEPLNITIGSSDAIIDIYNIRIYDKGLNRFQSVNNWIADMQDGEQLLREFNRNNIYDDNDMVSLEMLKKNLPTLPYIVVDLDSLMDKKGNKVDKMPQYKGNKMLCSGYYVDPNDENNSFSWKNAEIDVQGTSSQYYPIKNYKVKFKPTGNYGTPDAKPTDCSGFIMTKESEKAGKEVCKKKFSMRGKDSKGKDLSIPVSTFTFKADFASSEGCNNVELVRFYDDTCPYRTPPQAGYPLIRQGIDGFPCVWFSKKNVNGKDEFSFIGKYNFNNDKGTEDIFGLSYHGEEFDEVGDNEYFRVQEGSPDQSWEVKDNNSQIALWKRVAGTVTTTKLEDSTGKSVTYRDYLKDGSTELQKVKEESLYPMYDGTYDESKLTEEEIVKYRAWVPVWQSTYESADDWITQLSIPNVNDTADYISDEDMRAQRDFAQLHMKKDIVVIFNLTETTVTISPEEDMLGEWGSGGNASMSFEIRFPGEWNDAHLDGFPEVMKVDKFVALQEWVVSTDKTKATNTSLPQPVTYTEGTFTEDTAEYRKYKFKNELKNYFDVNDTLYYYLFTETFLMIDSRVKNSFPTYFAITEEADMYKACESGSKAEEGETYYKNTDGTYTEYSVEAGSDLVDDLGNALYTKYTTEVEKVDANGWPLGRWCWLPYDMDTANGINNEGLLVFTYSLEDTEALKGSQIVPLASGEGVPVYNGADSVFWTNVRDSFPNELMTFYFELRGNSLYNYETIEKRFEEHQGEWSAAIFNEDSYYKYVRPLVEDSTDYLGMCQGSKEQQRKWWLFNRFRFLDSKYTAGDAFNNTINFRVNDLEGDKTITVTPYIDLYLRFKLGEQLRTTPVKVWRNQPQEIFVDVDQAGDTESSIYSADQIKEIKDLNKKLHISTVDISKALNLQNFDVSAPKEKPNTTLTYLNLGANRLMRVLDASYCSVLGSPDAKHTSQTIDMTQCDQLEEARFIGTQITSVKLPEGGRLRKISLPNTIVQLNINSQMKIEELNITDTDGNWNTDNLSSVDITNVNQYVQDIVFDKLIPSLSAKSYFRFYGFDITVDSYKEFVDLIDKIDTFNGIEGNVAQLQGTIHLNYDVVLDYSYYSAITSRYKDLVVDCMVKKTVTFKDAREDSAELDKQFVISKYNEAGTVEFKGVEPTREETEDFHYIFKGWSLNPLTTEDDAPYNSDYEIDEDFLSSVRKDIEVYAYYEAVPVYRVNFLNYDGVEILQSLRLWADAVDAEGNPITEVKFTASLPTYNNDDSIPFEGWGTKKYAGADIESSGSEDDYRTIYNVSSDMNIIAQMGWHIAEGSMRVVNPPEKVLYYINEVFDPMGMVIFVDKDTPEGNLPVETLVYDYDKTPMSKATTDIAIWLKGSSEENRTSQRVSVAQSIYVSKEPDDYFHTITRDSEGNIIGEPEDYIDLSGMEITVVYSEDAEGNTPKTLGADNYKWEPVDASEDYLKTEGTRTLRIYYEGLDLECELKVVLVYGISDILEENSWEVIASVTNAGLAQSYWKVGDRKSISIPSRDGVNGYPQGKYYFSILAFDHNIEQEAPRDESGNKLYEHSTTFGLTEGYILSGYPEGSNFNDVTYKMMSLKNVKPWGGPTDYAGQDINLRSSWHKGCDLKTAVQEFEAVLPESLRALLKTSIKGQRDRIANTFEEIGWNENPYFNIWTDDILTQEDKLFIPSLYEITGLRIPGYWTLSNGKYVWSEDKTHFTVSESEVCKQFPYYRSLVNSIDSSLESLVRYERNLGTLENGDTYCKPHNYWTRSYHSNIIIKNNSGNREGGNVYSYLSFVDGYGNIGGHTYDYNSGDYVGNTRAGVTPCFNI